MKLLILTGNQMREVVDQANAKGIQKDQILSIVQEKDGTFILTYFAEE